MDSAPPILCCGHYRLGLHSYGGWTAFVGKRTGRPRLQSSTTDESLNRPGGNLTGIVNLHQQLAQK
jgi:hypothetical protein